MTSPEGSSVLKKKGGGNSGIKKKKKVTGGKHFRIEYLRGDYTKPM